MNDTQFAIYKSGVAPEAEGGSMRDIKSHALTRQLYVQNCDRKHAGNLSSIYQTILALFNTARQTFYYTDEIVNTFLEKLRMTINGKLQKHAEKLRRYVLGAPLPAKILEHILDGKFRRSTSAVIAEVTLTPDLVHQLLDQVRKSAP